MKYMRDLEQPHTIFPGQKLYIAGMLEMKAQAIYPDANSTMRLTWESSQLLTKDGVIYDYVTTMDGVMQIPKLGVCGPCQTERALQCQRFWPVCHERMVACW